MSDTPRDRLTVETREDLVLIRRAVHAGWPTNEQLAEMRDEVFRTMKHGKTERLRLAAAKVAVAVFKAELDAMQHVHNVEMKVLDKEVPDLHQVGGSVQHRVTTKELLDQAEYVEWLRERERDSDPRFIRANGHEGNGKPVDDGHTRNGH